MCYMAHGLSQREQTRAIGNDRRIMTKAYLLHTRPSAIDVSSRVTATAKRTIWFSDQPDSFVASCLFPWYVSVPES